MPNPLNRRSFLKAGLIGAGAAAAATLPVPSIARASADDDLCTLLDIRKCIACEACVDACREANADKYPAPEGKMPKMLPEKRVKIEDWSPPEKQAVTDRLTPYNWLFIQYAAGTYQGEEYELSIPRRCMHCHNPPCSKLCPFGAAYSLPNGIVRIHPDLCFGGAKCRNVCPWHIPQRQSGVGIHLKVLPQYAGNGVMYKCDRCYDRIADGELPACIDVCPEELQEIGPRHEMVKKAHALAKEIGGFIYGEGDNGGTNTIYVSPVPFEVLNRDLSEKGKGRPPIKPMADAMAAPNNLIAALAIAPIAGAIGATGRFLSQASKKSDAATKTEDNG
jgi:formate dehydrogenase iron-sulfur subunit